jgi:hypothetical protein
MMTPSTVIKMLSTPIAPIKFTNAVIGSFDCPRTARIITNFRRSALIGPMARTMMKPRSHM